MISDDRLAELIVSMQGNVRIGSVADHVGDALMELRDRRRAALTPPQPSAVHDAYVSMCALLYPYQRNGETEIDALRRLVAPAQEHVAWLRYVRAHDRPTRIQLCDSDTPGAFKVYAAQPHDEAVALLRALEPHLDKLICYASTPDEYEPNAIVARIRAFLKDRT